MVTVQDEDSIVDVLLMIKHDNGSIGFVQWQNGGKCFDKNKVLSEKDGVEILKQRVELPMSLCLPYNIDKTVEELELSENKYIKDWKDLPLLKNCHFLLLDEDYQTELNVFLLTYSHEYGLITEKI